ncbi:phospho-acceptor domain-containing protein [Sphingobacterium allocomposti]|uniref:histidine kinase n=1 Tax=Sphingobacterium allocomposti TaxID=415956 RepID=A0A5S5D804_9SPHI|nr:HAMP domain-containing sensor histidine kinase [Sphingobacterium composti Yoo et al. 2007 non Ten et al. 2007]TYP91186.1 phospho-acceptor domain-containing protein [Sphingobacterium composti Yoo et al. 2007 non Ten et al. 2007]
MLKKYKILLAIAVLTAAGIALVLGVWLYGSYKSERDIFIGTAERSLFNVLQNYYQQELAPPARKNDTSLQETRHKGLLSLMRRVYPDLDLYPLKYTLDTLDYHRWRTRRSRDKDRNIDSPNQLLPLYLLEKIDFNEQLLDTLEPRLAAALARRGIRTSFQLTTDEIPRKQFEAYIAQRNKRGDLITRPILINPEHEQFLIAQFQNPWAYLLRQLGLQFVLSLLLLTALVGTFLYLLKTIRKQNQLALLQKSFVNNMTHELKTPVATVMAAVEAIQRFVAKDDKERMHTYLELSKNELEHLNTMIERVLQLDVDELQGIRLEKRPVDMVSLVQNCLETARISTIKEVFITFEPPFDVYLIHVDEAHIKNIVSNLLDNAIKYSGDPVYITVQLIDGPSHMQLHVADRGKGIAPEHIGYIYNMFYRVPEGNLHEVKGFGLGLAYVKQVVEQHGGTIHVKSELKGGSTFVLTIPKNG